MKIIIEIHQIIAKGEIKNIPQVLKLLEELMKNIQLYKNELNTFASVYPKLLDRLFGEEVTGSDNALADQTSSSNWTKLPPGGWIKSMINIDPIREKDLKNSYSTFLKYFLPFANIFPILDKISGKFNLKINLLPSKIQMVLSKHSLCQSFDTDSQNRLIRLLLQLNQFESFDGISKKQFLLLGHMEYFLVCLIRYPTISNSFFSNGNIRLKKSPTDAIRSNQTNTWLEDIPYLALFQEYLNEFFGTKPISNQNPPSTSIVVSDKSVLKYREIILRLAVEYWIDLILVLNRDHYKLSSYKKILGQFNQYSNQENQKERPHPHPTEIVLLDSSSFRWTIPSIQCTYLLVKTLMKELCSSTIDISQSYDFNSLNSSQLNQFVQTPFSYLLLQRSIFDMIRCVFSKGDQTIINREIVLLVVEIWLLWIQPWTANNERMPDLSTNIKWKSYLYINYHFYTTLFICFRNFFSKLSLSLVDEDGLKNLELLERVFQVFSPSFMKSIDEMSQSFSKWSIHQLSPTPSSNTTTPLKRLLSEPKAYDEPNLCFLAKFHHELLFPDRKLDYLEDRGITNINQMPLKPMASIVANLELILIDKTPKDPVSDFIESFLEKILQMFQWEEDTSASLFPRHPVNQRVQILLNNIFVLFPNVKTYHEANKNLNDPHRSEKNNLLNNQMIRDPITGNLTAIGKQMLLEGKLRCAANDWDSNQILLQDPLKLPICSYEWKPLALLFIYLSRWLNNYYQFPKEERYIHFSWSKLIQERRRQQPQLSLFTIFLDSYRVNLRGLGHPLVFLSSLFISILFLVVLPYVSLTLVMIAILFMTLHSSSISE